MNITSIGIRNVKSFREETQIQFDPDFNILVGPNAGGKSNLLDIITIVMRHFFIFGYIINAGPDQGIFVRNLQKQEIFRPVNTFLEKFIGEDGDSVIDIQLAVSHNDLSCMKLMRDQTDSFEESLSAYRGKPIQKLDFLDRWDLTLLHDGQVLSYRIVDGKINGTTRDSPEWIFREYLNYVEMFLILASGIPESRLTPNYLYFSPYRAVTPQDQQANLSSENYHDQLVRYFGTTSKDSASLIKVASLYFADKHRRYEGAATDHGYEDKWQDDYEVKLVTKYMTQLGYDWDLELVDGGKNIYEIRLSRDGRDFLIGQASSGEKEIFNFLFGIFAFTIQGGLIIVDEPELHLHPKWRAVLRDLLIEVGVTTKNQVLLATHSPTFITPQTIGNIRRLLRDDTGATAVPAISDANPGDKKALLHIVTTHNNEKMFFADSVVLVEGIKDRLVFESLINLYGANLGLTDIIEVLEVRGKGNFDKYRRFLDSMGVKNFIVADQDYACNIGTEEIEKLFEVDLRKIDENVLRNKKSKDLRSLHAVLREAVDSKDLQKLREFLSYIESRHLQLVPDLGKDQRGALHSFIGEQRKSNIFILKEGEIEDYLPDGYKDLDKTIELVREENLKSWLAETIGQAKRNELDDIVFAILGASKPERKRVLDQLADQSSTDHTTKNNER